MLATDSVGAAGRRRRSERERVVRWKDDPVDMSLLGD